MRTAIAESQLIFRMRRHRHLLADLHSLLPHSRKDAKLDTKTQLYQLNELADLYNCNNVMFFEARKGKDLYIWLSKPPNGPTLKLHCQNIHTMEELNFPGNCLKGSRPVLSFDKAFDDAAHTRVIKELLTHAFGVPQSSRKVKPFVDHVMGFTLADGRIWIRCYQIAETEPSKKQAAGKEDKDGVEPATAAVDLAPVSKAKPGETAVSLIEIGPRLVLTPIVILEGSFGGPVIYENKQFISPNQVRHRRAASLAKVLILLTLLNYTDPFRPPESQSWTVQPARRRNPGAQVAATGSRLAYGRGAAESGRVGFTGALCLRRDHRSLCYMVLFISSHVLLTSARRYSRGKGMINVVICKSLGIRGNITK